MFSDFRDFEGFRTVISLPQGEIIKIRFENYQKVYKIPNYRNPSK